MRKKRSTRGLTLVEVMLGIAVIIFVLAAGVIALHHIVGSEANTSMRSKVDQKLQSMAEEIRQRAQSEFNTISSTITLRADSMYPQIVVTKNIDAIDPTTGTRKVILRAVWQEGRQQQTKDLTFYIAPIRGRYAGGRVAIRVVNALNPTVGIRGVTVRAPGQDLPEVLCVTEADGTCDIAGVQMVSGLGFKFDGYPVAYFHSPGDEYTVSTPTGTWSSVITSAETITPYAVVTIEIGMYPTSTVEGLLEDAGDGNAVPAGVVIALRKKPGTLAIDNDSDLTTTSNLNGRFIFNNVVPGHYSIHVIGNYRYGATAIPGDYSAANRNKWATLSLYSQLSPLLSGRTVKFDGTSGQHNPLWTIKRGSFLLQVQGVEADGSNNLVVSGGPDNNYPVDMIVTTDRTRVTYSPTGSTHEFKDTVPYRDFYQAPHQRYSVLSRYALKTTTVTLRDSNAREIGFLGPAVFHEDRPSYTASEQYTTTQIQPHIFVPDPYVPILAARTDTTLVGSGSWGNGTTFNSDNLMFLHMGVQFWFDFITSEVPLPAVAPNQYTSGDPRNRTLADFTFKLNPNHLNTPSEKALNFDNSFYLLHKNALANVEGFIVNGSSWEATAGQPFNPCAFLNTIGFGPGWDATTRCIQISKVYVSYWNRGAGGVKISTIHPNMNFLAHDYDLPTGINSAWSPSAQQPGVGGQDHTFRLKSYPDTCWHEPGGFITSHKCLGVPPNVGNDVTRIYYLAGPQPAAPNRVFHLEFRGLEKKMVGGVVSTTTVTGSVHIDDLLIRTCPMYNQWNPTTAGVDVTGWTQDISRIGFSGYSFQGFVDVPSLKPGETRSFVDLPVDKGRWDHSPYWVTVENDDGSIGEDDDWQFSPPPGTIDSWFYFNGTAYTRSFPIDLYRKVNVNVYGRVANSDNSTVAIPNATVTLLDHQRGTLAQTTTNSSGNYQFRDIKVVPRFDVTADIYLQVEPVAGYNQTQAESYEVYNEPDGSGIYGCDLQDGTDYPACRTINVNEFQLEPVVSGSGEDL